MTEPADLSPEEGAQALFALMIEINEASADGDLDRLETIIDQMQVIVAQTGVEMPAMAEKIAGLKGQSKRAKVHLANTDAALWAGDLKRAEHLSIAGPGLNFAALNIALDDEHTGADQPFGEDPEPEDDALEFDLADFAASLGVDLDLEDEEVDEDDRFADLADGVEGALDALLQSGADLNMPSGPQRYTALLAALDAPGRSAATIQRLIDAGADPLVVHSQGDNALSWAMGYHHPDSVSPESEAALINCLVSHGADPNHSVSEQITALQRGILQAGAPHVAALLAHGADHRLDMAEDFLPEMLGSATSVMLAAPKPDVLAVLLDHGADAARPDAKGRLPLEFVQLEADAARDRVDIDDEWTVDHAEALEISLGILERHLSKQA